MSRFNLTIDMLPADIQASITMLEVLTTLRFKRAEDWTRRNEGYVLQFGDLAVDDDMKYKEVEDIINRLFPSIEYIEHAKEGFRLLI